MYSRLFITIVFFSGLGAGWFVNSWLAAKDWNLITSIRDVYDNKYVDSLVNEVPAVGVAVGATDSRTPEIVVSTNYSDGPERELADGNENATRSLNALDHQKFGGTEGTFATSARDGQKQTDYELNNRSSSDRTGASASEILSSFLNERLYAKAVAFYEAQKQQRGTSADRLKSQIFDELKHLSNAKNNNDFSALAESYLSIYYDDVEVLLLLANFNQANGDYFEVVDAYLLAKTYAYSIGDQDNVVNRFNSFVEVIDDLYTGQQNWSFLLDFYTYIDTSGLMTSVHQYRQAIAYLRSGDEFFAVQQLNLLLNDTLVAKSAERVLNSLRNDSELPIVVHSSPLQGAESVALQKIGNQYAAVLTNNRRDSAKLLIDTGASMTALSRESFNRLNINGDAVAQGLRTFRTANGPTQGAVFLMRELTLGSYVLKNTLVAVIDFDSGRGIDGLLGMNILGQFSFHIEQEQSRLLLSRN